MAQEHHLLRAMSLLAQVSLLQMAHLSRQMLTTPLQDGRMDQLHMDLAIPIPMSLAMLS